MLSWNGLIDKEHAMLFESSSLYIGTRIFYSKVLQRYFLWHYNMPFSRAFMGVSWRNSDVTLIFSAGIATWIFEENRVADKL